MTSIPNDYLNSSFDFGFTVVDDPDDQNLHKPPPLPQEELYAPVLSRLGDLESNVNEIRNILERLEQAGTPQLDTDEYKALIERDVKAKLQKVEAMVMPLLTNLLKDADDKEYIKWPNRRPIIQSFIEKFLAVTRS